MLAHPTDIFPFLNHKTGREIAFIAGR